MSILEPTTKLKVPRKEIFAWAMYDFANSTFATIVATAVFSAYFVDVVASGKESGFATLLLTATACLSSLIVVATAPILGSIADIFAIKKPLLLTSTIGCIGCTALLSQVDRGEITFALFLLFFAYICYGTGENLIAAFLPEIATPQSIGKVSAFGWMLGYLGAFGVLIVCLLYAYQAEAAGVKSTEYVPRMMLITATSFALASAITFAGLKERAKPQLQSAKKGVIELGYTRLRETLRKAGHYRDLFAFLRALFVFSCGTTTVVALAAIYAQEEMGFQPIDTILLIAVVNLTGAIGTPVFGFIQDKIGSIKTLKATLIMWIIAIIIAAVSPNRTWFWLAANLTGIAMGSSLSISRALVGRFSPPNRCAEFFGLWGLAIKLATALGPLSFGLVTYLTNNNFRAAILVTISFFVAGFWLLQDVDEERGIQKAER
jgi:UMF1 family MFS transporter